MSKHRHGWPEAKKLCRLNQNDITMAKSLGFRPDSLVRARPDPKQKWKLPVKLWIHELHRKRFGYILGEATSSAAPPHATPEAEEEAARLYEEELYWEDYADRNRDDCASVAGPSEPAPPRTPRLELTDEDTPF